MTGQLPSTWLIVFGLFYVSVMLYWARVAARENGDHETYFSAGHSLTPWVSAVVLAGASVSGWFVLGGTQMIATNGFAVPAVLTAGVTLALPGVIFFKRIWYVGQRLRLSSQAEIFRSYYKSDFLVVVSTVIAVLFAVGFAGLQMRALSQMMALLTNDMVSPLSASVVLGIILFAGVAIGGMRAVGYFGVIQTVLCFAATIALAGFSLYWSGGFAALNAGLAELAARPDAAAMFSIDGVIQFTSGLGRGGELAKTDTAVASLSLAMAFMGFQASPLALKIVLSTRSGNGFGAGQTWVLAGVFGWLIVFAMAIIGAAGIAEREMSVTDMLIKLQASSPWFAGWIFIGVAAGVQLLAGLALLTAGECLVRNVYKPYFQSSLSRRGTVTLTRIVIAVMAVAAMLLQSLTPVTLSALAGLALPMAFQLWTPLLGVTWLRWITRPAAVAGVGFGIAGVILTEPLGYQVLAFLGLELPWGRWPWTVHSAAWGMAANLAAVFIISAITNRQAFGEEAIEVRRFLASTLRISNRARSMSSTAWSVGLAWFFLAIGPGLIFGNSAFGQIGAEGGAWIVGMPSLWAWSLASWITGVGLVWFLAYRMEMASPNTTDIPAYQPARRLRHDTTVLERERVRVALIAGAAVFLAIAVIAFIFGG
jgi:SSS family solute:Na+ symporter